MSFSTVFLYCMAFCFGDSVRVDSIHVIKEDSVTKSIKLDNILIEGSKVIHYPDKDVWTITKEMRKNTFDTYSLLSKIPGFYYDTFRERLLFWGRENVLVTVDGRAKDEGYGGSLANMRFKKIEVYDHPDGRFAGYDVVVNLITYENWQGYDARGLNTATLMPSSDYGNVLGRRTHNYTYTYTRPKFDVSSNIKYNYINTKYNQSMDIIGNGIWYHSENKNDNSYTNLQELSNYSLYVDIDYKITKKHTVSIKYSILDENTDTESKHDIFKEDIATNYKVKTERYASYNSGIKEHAISTFYQGSIKNWVINSELTHDIYSEDSRYSYSEFTDYKTNSFFENKRKSWLLSLEAVANMGRSGVFNAGYIYYDRKYLSHEIYLAEDYTSRLERNKGYMSFSHSLGKKFSLKLGVSAENIGMTNATGEDNQILWGVNAVFRYGGMKDKFSGSLSYRNNTSYPTLYQTMTIKNQSDPLLSYIGNTKLKASIAHSFVVSIRFGRININSVLSHSGNEIMPIYYQYDTSVFHSYANIETFKHSSVLSYSPQSIIFLGNALLFRGSLTYAGTYIGQSYNKKYLDNWGGQASLDYNIKNFANIQIQYTKMTKKGLYSQVMSQRANDFWEIIISKDFLKQHLQCQVSYTCPLKWGIESLNYTKTLTPFYKSYTEYDSFCYTKNQIMVRIVIRFANGHTVRKRYNEQTQEKEIFNDIIN